MLSLPWWVVPAVALFALPWSTLQEWLIHKLMHEGRMLLRRHAIHHKLNWHQGWFGEFRDYQGATLAMTLVTLPISIQIGLGFAIGGTIYAAFAAYSHQVQHQRPELVFWMKKPVHYLHHRENMWKHNFGIGVDWWDRILGTYKDVEYVPAIPRDQLKVSDYFKITWIGRRPTKDDIRRAGDAIDRGDDSPDEIHRGEIPASQ